MSLRRSILALLCALSPTAIARIVTVDCDHAGAANFDTIDKAVTAINPTGGVIQITSGTCREPLLYVASNVTLIGEGNSTTILSHGQYAFKIWGQNNVTIKNMRILPDNDNILTIESRSSNHLTIENIEIVGTGGGNGISIFGGRAITLKGNHISKSKGHGISIANMDAEAATFVNISGNFIEDAAMSCINVSDSKQVAVSDNFVSGCGSREKPFGGVRLSNGSEQVTVTGNVISGTARGIFLTSGSRSISVSGNTIENTLFHGILVENVDNVSLTGNTVKDTHYNDGGIRIAAKVNGIVLSGNHVSGSQGPGIRVSFTPPGSVGMFGNVLSCNTGPGIVITSDSAAGTKAEGNLESSASCNPANLENRE